MEWCDNVGIGELSEETMASCLRIPPEGIDVVYIDDGFKTCHRPVCDESRFAPLPIKNLGLYCAGINRVMFVYRDGHTYVTKRGKDFVEELEQAGYKECETYIPFTEQEEICNAYFAAKWAQIPEG